MATPEEQITPADAAIVTTGTGRKGPEEHDLPESLKYDMDLCLEILRNVLGEYNPELLSTFDTVRHYAVEASAEHFAELKDPNPDQDGLKEAVNVIDNMTLHDAQLLARAFATYFHLANLSEENYRVAQLREREALCAFIRGIQQGAPVDSFVVPEPSPMPGYDCDVIMASGSFTFGSSIELSADAPLREPFAAWMQGGVNFNSGRLGAILAAQSMLNAGFLNL